MKNRIEILMEVKKKSILSIYFTAGYPELNSTTNTVRWLAEAGVDMIEIGFPFSDPLADGETIQKSSLESIRNGMTLQLLFEQLKEIRSFTNIPVILMGYLNPVLQFGEKLFIEKCKNIGIDGVIIPDLPINYYNSHFKKYCEANNIFNILLISPETKKQRIKQIAQVSKGFLYMVSTNSITGKNKDLNKERKYFERIKKMNLCLPTIMGFGIHDKKSFQFACNYAQGAIIGSAFIKIINEEGLSQKTIQKFIQKIK